MSRITTIFLLAGMLQVVPATERDMCDPAQGASCTPSIFDEDGDLSSLLQAGSIELHTSGMHKANKEATVSETSATEEVAKEAAPTQRSTPATAKLAKTAFIVKAPRIHQVSGMALHLKPAVMLADHSTRMVRYLLNTGSSPIFIFIAVIVGVGGLITLMMVYSSKMETKDAALSAAAGAAGQRLQSPQAPPTIYPTHGGPSLATLQMPRTLFAPHWPVNPPPPVQPRSVSQGSGSPTITGSPTPINAVLQTQVVSKASMYSSIGEQVSAPRAGSSGEQFPGSLGVPVLPPAKASTQRPQKHSIESRFLVPLVAFSELEPDCKVDVLSVEGQPVMSMKIIGGQRLEVGLLKDSGACWSVVAPTVAGGLFNITCANNQSRGTIKSLTPGTAEVVVGGKTIMTVEGDSYDFEFLAWSPGGKPVAITKVNNEDFSSDHLEVRVLPGHDNTLVVAVLLALIWNFRVSHWR